MKFIVILAHYIENGNKINRWCDEGFICFNPCLYVKSNQILKTLRQKITRYI